MPEPTSTTTSTVMSMTTSMTTSGTTSTSVSTTTSTSTTTHDTAMSMLAEASLILLIVAIFVVCQRRWLLRHVPCSKATAPEPYMRQGHRTYGRPEAGRDGEMPQEGHCSEDELIPA
eukprot:gnl/TRDRNA2_/TRDRNA2_164733_c0_seq1.p1 gnl/TRDRNA2_/TRDRNA2_164733_c0~~gnl/TRDRNA2_/TRDRNA2_164733_c0_seq1.p1  ORF type:complete len:137 (+),score=8.64 gnl/TRDRNA2_/TRDRNA2_164733_c0_seq1:63-413(+)